MLLSLSAPSISRLNFLPKPSLFTAFRRNQLLPHKYSSRNFVSCVRHKTPKRDGDLVVLGIETSCDDTAAAVVRSDGEILSQVVSSQADLLVKYGGVAPKMAEEAHSQVIDQVVQAALDKAYMTEKDLTAVAVTIGPGLSLCLRVGVQKARRIAGGFNLPIIGIHHMEAHALVARLIEKDLQFPFMALLISGGHNLLILARDLGQYIQLGTTIDDAIGEAYDKTAKWLGLDMRRSGGPAMEELAREGNAESVSFSVPMKQHKDCNFSYAGLKTQVRLAIESKKMGEKLNATSLEAWMKESKAPALDHTLDLFHEIKNKGINVFLISSRKESLRSPTVDNLVKVGYHGWTRLTLRGLDDELMEVRKYHSKVRQQLVEEGYRIWGIVGDQWSSFEGLPIAKRTFKLPNSMYYIA